MKKHSVFTSSREKMLWIASLLILTGILLSLFVGRPFLDLLRNQNLQAGIFLLGMTVIGLCIILYGIISKPQTIELILILGIAAVYILLFLRLGLPERSHLIEYSALSLSIHQALTERIKQGKRIPYPEIWAISISVIIGIIDELIQLFIPDRVFDPEDIVFNCIAIVLAIGSSRVLQIMKKKWSRKH